MATILICKDASNQLIAEETKIFDSSKGSYSILNVPDIVERVGSTGKYEWNAITQTFDIIYTEIPKTSVEIAIEELKQQMQDEILRSKKTQAEILEYVISALTP